MTWRRCWTLLGHVTGCGLQWSASMPVRLQAMSTQEANRAASNKMPPLWAAAAIVLLGWNEFLTVLYNPLWLFIGLIIFLFGKARRQQACLLFACCSGLSSLRPA